MSKNSLNLVILATLRENSTYFYIYPFLITEEYLGNLNFSELHNFINPSFFFQAIYNIQYPLRFYYSIYE